MGLDSFPSAPSRSDMTNDNESINVLALLDDPALEQAIQGELERHGYQYWSTRNPENVFANSDRFRLALVDQELLPNPQELSRIRNSHPRPTLILFSTLERREHRIAALEAGVDDFLLKPFEMSELLARMEACMVRLQHQPNVHLQAGPLSIDLASRRVTRGQRQIALTPTEFRLLEALMRNAGRIVTRSMLAEVLWDLDWDRETNVIEVHINRLRAKITRGDESRLIFTVRGSGYTLRWDSVVTGNSEQVRKLAGR